MSNSSQYGAPVCNVTPAKAPVVTPSTALPAIPVATDMPTLLSAVNTMRNIIQRQANQIGSSFSAQAQPDKNKQKKPPNSGFNEIATKRVYKTVKVSNPKDASQYVYVKQIVGLSFENPQTKQTITWAQ